MPSKDPCQTFTYQTRLKLDESSSIILDSYAQLMSRIERQLFADLCKGKAAADLKVEYIKKHQITARQFNALRIQIEGKISSIRESRLGLIKDAQFKITSIQKSITGLEKRAPGSEKLHQKKRRLANLKRGLEQLQSDQTSGRVSMCFGSRRLFKAQFALEENGYRGHEQWLEDWRQSRSNSFFLVGSKDESSGNQSCVATIAEDGSLQLRLRLPPALDSQGKYLFLPQIQFDYGHENIVEALGSCLERKKLQNLSCPEATHYGVALSYRFKRDKKGWRVFISIPVQKRKIVTSQERGVIGIDINADHLAITETDRFGNPIAKKSIPLNTYGKNRNQTKALIGNVCAIVVDDAKRVGKPLVIEHLDFQKRKAELRDHTSPALARMLSGLAYNSIINGVKSRAWRSGVEVTEVNPAFTSIIGRVKFAKRYGLSVHHAAALAIGRRHLRASERVPRHLESIPDGKGSYVALSLPVRNRDKHVWHTWGILNRRFKTVLAAHFRAMKNRSSSSKSAGVTQTIPDFVGGIPAGESVNTTARLTSLNISTTVIV